MMNKHIATTRVAGWNSPALKIAHRELNDSKDYLGIVGELVHDAMQQVEDADKANDSHEIFYLQLAEDGTAIRKWSRSPFEGARMCRVALETVSA